MTEIASLKQPRNSKTREERQAIRQRLEAAKGIRFSPIQENIYQYTTIWGTYILENTCSGPLPWRARRNGTLVRGGMTVSRADAVVAISEDIKRRKKH